MSGHNERAHRRFSPSQAERFTVCHGSTNLLKRVPARANSEYAIEGTKAHEILDTALANGVRDAETAHREYSSLCMEDLNTIDNMFYFAIDMALNYVYGLLDEYTGSVLYTERYVNPPSEVAPGETGGYCDIAIWAPAINTLFVIDYKHGAGIAKDVKGNPQSMQYAAGFLYEENAVVPVEQVNTVVMTIVQPRAFHEDGPIREQDITPYELYEYICWLDDQIAQNLKDDAPLVPDDGGKTKDHCRFCDANTVCPARETKALVAVGSQFKTVQMVRKPDLPDVRGLDINRLAHIRLAAPMLRKFLDDVENHCYELAMGGHEIPGAKLVETQARRQYYGDEEDVAKKAAALAGVSVNDVMIKKLMPVTSLEKLIVEAFKKRVGRGKKAQAAEDARQAFAFLTLKQSSGNLKLVDEDDPAPAVNRAVHSFKQMTAVLPPPIQET